MLLLSWREAQRKGSCFILKQATLVLVAMGFCSLEAYARVTSFRASAPPKYGPQNPQTGGSLGEDQEASQIEVKTSPEIVLAQNTASKSSVGGASPAGKKDGKKAKNSEPVETLELPKTPIEMLSLSPKETKAVCARYEGRLVAFYSEVYKVEQCKRRHIVDSKTVYDLVSRGQTVVDVEREVIVALPEGEPYDVRRLEVDPKVLCRRFNNQYVTYSYVDVYFVEGCKRRLFPDWTTYTTHRTKRGGDPKSSIEALDLEEFAAIEEGEPIASVVDEMFSKLLSGEAGIDLIPVDEACRGLESHVVSFYSRLYRIEKCRKRELLGLQSIFRVADQEAKKIEELTAEKWLSLPEGEPIWIKGADRFDQSKGPPRGAVPLQKAPK